MLKLKLAGLLSAATATVLLLATAPAATADPFLDLPGCTESIERAIADNNAAIAANVRHDTEDALDANQDVQGDALSAVVLCVTRSLGTTLSLLAATLSNAQAMTANDRGPSGEGTALAAERKTDKALRDALSSATGAKRGLLR